MTPPNSNRRPRTRRAAGFGLAGALAIAGVATPVLLGSSSSQKIDTTAAAATDIVPTPLSTAPVSTVPEEAQPHHGIMTAADTGVVRFYITYAQATPEQRVAIGNFLSPPPPPPPPAPAPAPQPAPVRFVAPAPVQVVQAPAAASGSVWDRLAQCESGGNWAIHTGNGFSGGLQFVDSTWRAYGGGAYAPVAWQASRDAQITVAERVLAAAGWGSWPACSSKLGLR